MVSLLIPLIPVLAATTPRVSFRELGPLPSGAYAWEPTAISADGKTVVGRAFYLVPDGPQKIKAAKWTEEHGVVLLGDLPGDFPQSDATGVSADGTVIVGNGIGEFGVPRIGFRWTAAQGMVALDPNHGNSPAFAISADGSVIAGENFGGAYRWTVTGGFQQLGFLPGGSSSIAYAMSASGLAIAGESSTADSAAHAFRWTVESGMQDLGYLAIPGGAPSTSNAWGISSDGSVVVGASTCSLQHGSPILWSAASGMTPLDQLACGENRGGANGAASHGTVIVGTASLYEAFAWEPFNGMNSLKNLLVDAGVDSVEGWNLHSAVAIAQCGRFVVGFGSGPAGQQTAWRAEFPFGDADADGIPDAWEVSAVDADFDGLPDFDLRALGVGPSHKDVIVEIDCMSGLCPQPETLELVRSAFANVPNDLVRNIDGQDGIALHFLLDEQDLTPGAFISGNPSAEFLAVKQAHFGTPGDSTYTKAAKHLIYRYCLFGHSFGGTDTSGRAEIYGDDLLVTLGHPLWPVYGGTINQQAGTLMHELGHTLGLRHGGSDAWNHKPNYHSVMNYSWQIPALTTGADLLSPELVAYMNSWQLDYSREELPLLREAALSEPVGIGAPSPHSTHMLRVGPPAATVNDGIVSEFGPVDWNRDLDHIDSPVSADINRLFFEDLPSPGQVLVGHNDWEAIDLTRCSDKFRPGVVDFSSTGRELGAKLAKWLAKPGLQADLDSDDDVDLVDVAVLQNCFGDLQGVCDKADIDYSGRVDLLDLRFQQEALEGPD